ncbi:MFS transporter [Pseudoxanthomonas indica]|uniref:Major Facilitator Superfamily protein n=1 Tax=Pseudoxanthomonas indica TaxID=428993 RepID=A0A1T5LPB0_9GAMM|nr:MFS transporter [Pseudoxanthomonas indica]SKC77741.1 Major Facilitator Superfamily protein [Pseudoxanthomonas indica]
MSTAAAISHRDFTRHDAKTLGLAALGGALEFYDFVVFVFFTKVLGELFFPPGTAPWLAQLQVYGIFAAGYLARPLGGIVMAHFGDRGGRKRMFTLSVLLMAVPTLLIGLLPTYAQIGVLAPLLLLLLRIVQGIAVGGEVPGAWVFVAEHVPANRIGFACASLTAGLTAGILIGSLLATWINTAFSPAEVSGGLWRVPFLLGGAFGLFAVFLRRWLQETPVFIAMQARRELVQGLPVRDVLAGHGGAVLRGILASWLLTAAIVVGVLLTPNLVQAAFQLPASLAFLGGSIATTALIVGCLLSGWAVDRLGVAVTILVGSLLLLACIYLLYWPLAQGDQSGFLWHYALLGLSIGVTGAVPSLLIHAFPPAVRFSGVSFSYNVAYALFGAMTPPLVAWLAQRLGPLAPAHYVAFTCVMGVLLSSWMLTRRSAPG